MKSIFVLWFLILSASISFAETTVGSTQKPSGEASKYLCVSTTQGYEKYLWISVGADIEIQEWKDRELIGSLFVDMGFNSLRNGWHVANTRQNCWNNICPSFYFDPKEKILEVHLFENDDMSTYYEQTYQCKER